MQRVVQKPATILRCLKRRGVNGPLQIYVFKSQHMSTAIHGVDKTPKTLQAWAREALTTITTTSKQASKTSGWYGDRIYRIFDYWRASTLQLRPFDRGQVTKCPEYLSWTWMLTSSGPRQTGDWCIFRGGEINFTEDLQSVGIDSSA